MAHIRQHYAIFLYIYMNNKSQESPYENLGLIFDQNSTFLVCVKSKFRFLSNLAKLLYIIKIYHTLILQVD